MTVSDPVILAVIVALSNTLPVYLNYRSNMQRTAEHKVTTAAIEVVRKDVNGSNARALQVKGEAEHAKGVLEGEAKADEILVKLPHDTNQS